MSVAEERHEAAIAVAMHQHAHLGRLGDGLGRHGIARLVDGAEIFAVDVGVRGVLACQHGVGLGAGRDQDGARRQGRRDLLAALLALDLERRAMAVGVDLDRHGRQAFGEADVLLQCLVHFLVVERIGRRIDQSAAIGDSDAAPAIDQPGDGRRALLARGRRALFADSLGVGDELIADLTLLPAPAGPHHRLAALGDQRLVTGQELLDLQRIIGERLGRRVDRRQAATAGWRSNPSWRRL